MSYQASVSPSIDELFESANDKVSLGLLMIANDRDPDIQNVLNHIHLFNQSIRTSPESTITISMANLGVSQMKTINKAAGMNNHPNSVKTLAKAFFEALAIPVFLYTGCTSTKPSRIML